MVIRKRKSSSSCSVAAGDQRCPLLVPCQDRRTTLSDGEEQCLNKEHKKGGRGQFRVQVRESWGREQRGSGLGLGTHLEYSQNGDDEPGQSEPMDDIRLPLFHKDGQKLISDDDGAGDIALIAMESVSHSRGSEENDRDGCEDDGPYSRLVGRCRDSERGEC